MNLPEYFTMVLDEREAKYIRCITDYEGFQHQRDSRDEALQRLKEIVALRAVLKIHNTFDVVHETGYMHSEDCLGCGGDSGYGGYAVSDVNKCPTLLALVEPYSDRADFRSWT